LIEAFSTGFYSTLKGNSALQTKLSGSVSDYKIYNTIAKQSATLPYIVFGVLTDTPQGVLNNLSAMEDMTFSVTIFTSTSVENCLEIADLVKTAMDDVSLTITGYTFMKCMREFTGNVNFDSDSKVYQLAMRYRVWASKD
jgi:hypothetical protein